MASDRQKKNTEKQKEISKEGKKTFDELKSYEIYFFIVGYIISPENIKEIYDQGHLDKYNVNLGRLLANFKNPSKNKFKMIRKINLLNAIFKIYTIIYFQLINNFGYPDRYSLPKLIGSYQSKFIEEMENHFIDPSADQSRHFITKNVKELVILNLSSGVDHKIHDLVLSYKNKLERMEEQNRLKEERIKEQNRLIEEMIREPDNIKKQEKIIFSTAVGRNKLYSELEQIDPNDPRASELIAEIRDISLPVESLVIDITSCPLGSDCSDFKNGRFSFNYMWSVFLLNHLFKNRNNNNNNN